LQGGWYPSPAVTGERRGTPWCLNVFLLDKAIIGATAATIMYFLLHRFYNWLRAKHNCVSILNEATKGPTAANNFLLFLQHRKYSGIIAFVVFECLKPPGGHRRWPPTMSQVLLEVSYSLSPHTCSI
ncbi:hypothetical protein ATANTOWER_008684, partial [Ataeniobius toweri]|nr:hypothetical protein [Ataeniobius toweri]